MLQLTPPNLLVSPEQFIAVMPLKTRSVLLQLFSRMPH